MIIIVTNLGLYYPHSKRNFQEQLKDLDRVGEIAGKSKFFLTVFLCLSLVQLSKLSFFLGIPRIYIPKKQVALSLKSNTSHIQDTLIVCRNESNSATFTMNIFLRSGIKNLKSRLLIN